VHDRRLPKKPGWVIASFRESFINLTDADPIENNEGIQGRGQTMRRSLIAGILLFVLFGSVPAFNQSSNARLGGTITDESGAIIPGVTVTVTNTATGVVNSTLSNNAGAYNFPSLLPGKYSVKAALSGFQTQTKTGLELGNAAQIRVNFELKVAGVATSVEVNIEAENLLLESSSSTGDVLPERVVQELPLVNSDALDLIGVMSGAVINDDPVFGREQTTFAGVSAANVNVQRDGVSISGVRYPTGITSPTRLNPDLVGEFRIVIAPVDAEMGRGVGQIQVQTKSGTNQFHGTLSWEVQNSGLDANFWQYNRDGTTRDWRNMHQYTMSLGGPIIKNKTFFFVLWNGQIARMRTAQTPVVLTPCARNGIFRYYDNWNNGAYGSTISTGATPTAPVVDVNGNPTPPPYLIPTDSNSGPHNGILRYVSVFGDVLNPDTINGDCSNAQVGGGPWDTYRTQVDPSGYIDDLLSRMPIPNYYENSGDGLNTAGYRWIQSRRGADNMYGVGEDNQRKEINVKIDHILTDRHRLNASWSFARNWADNNYAVWPNGFGGRTVRQPSVLTVNFTSTLTPSLLNEARVGYARNGTNGYSPLEDPVTGSELAALLPHYGDGIPIAVSPGTGSVNMAVGVSNIYGGRGFLTWSNRDSSPRWTIADTLSWTKGAHSFKFGAEVRLDKSLSSKYGIGIGQVTKPYAVGGNAPNAQIPTIVPANGVLAGTDNTGSQQTLQNLLTFFAGSLSSVNQVYFINSPEDLADWNNPATEDLIIRDFYQKELAFFFKDDWKVTPDLTLNLGLRYEYYGVPYLSSGMTTALEGGPTAMFGYSGRSFEEAFWKPGEQRADLTNLIFVGEGSANPDMRIFPRDTNNFGPAVGFAWQLPWFGKGRTTLRGGYQLTYLGIRGASAVEGIIGNAPGSTNNAVFQANDYLDIAHLGDVVPVNPGFAPMQPVPLTNRISNISVFDPNQPSPYIQNLTLAVTRNVRSNLTVDVRYVGTLTRKNYSSQNINVPNFRFNGLLDAFNAARYGEESQLLDDLFDPVRGTRSGAAYLRSQTRNSPSTGQAFGARYYLANGDYASLANIINYWPVGGEAGGLLRAANALHPGEFPENYIKTNPQFNNVMLQGNMGHANYHSMQAQVTLRPTYGTSFQASYTWSKNLDRSGAWTDPLDYYADYTLSASHRTHTFTTYGNFELPIGPNRPLFGNSSGLLAHLLESWQMSWIGRIYSGRPLTISAQNTLYANGTPDIVGPFDASSESVTWPANAFRGNLFGTMENYDPSNPQSILRYTKVRDPQCSSVDPSLTAFCSLNAIAMVDGFDSNGQPIAGDIVLQNALPGVRGTLGQNTLTWPTDWNVDMALSKTVRFKETMSFQVRVDVTNIFNHPQPAGSVRNSGTRYQVANAPSVVLNNTTDFGDLGSKAGNRTFQARLRFAF
jgi:hypothetical protein